LTENEAASGPVERVVVQDAEHIVTRGVASTTWYVRVNDAWVVAAKSEGANTESLDATPGTVWRRHVEMMLPRGTRLLRVESAPRPVQKSPLEYLEGSSAVGRKQRRVEYRVGPRGTLVREPAGE
jgi:hypothetical protein